MTGVQTEGPRASGTAPGIPYMSALDGLRAVAVLSVMAYHAGVSWMPAGFLGVDIFFVLSGFLITSLLVAEWRRRSTIGLRAFWSRRARRLLPALLVVLLFVVWFSHTVAPGTYPDLRSDALATLFYGANWHFIAIGQNYFAQAGPVSLLTHTWSLAIEEQFYVLWPLVVLLVLRATGSLRVLWRICVAGMVASALEMALLYRSGTSLTRLYYGTDTHAQCLLAGAALAVGLARAGGAGRHRATAADRWWSRRGQTLLAVSGLAAAAALVAMIATVSYGGGWLWQGGFLVVAGATSLVVLSVVRQPRAALTRALSVAPVRAVGRISYGLYLWHFPLFVWLDGARTGLGGTPLVLARFGATFAVATVSYVVIERPIRTGTFMVGWRARIAAPGAVACVLAAVLVGTASSSATTLGPAPHVAPLSRPGVADPTRVLLVGDSTAYTLAFGLSVTQTRFGNRLDDGGILGCGLVVVQQGEVDGQPEPVEPPCNASSPPSAQWPARWAVEISQFKPQIVAVLAGRWEVSDVEWRGRWTDIASAPFASYVRDQLRRAVAVASAGGAHVDLLTAPCYDGGEQPDGAPWPEDAPSRLAIYNGLVRSVAAGSDGVASVVDLDALVCPHGTFEQSIDGVTVRAPDGVHFPWVALSADEIADSDTPAQLDAFGAWVGPRLWPALLGPDGRGPAR